MHKLVAIIGNTGVGKSKLAIELAKKFNGEVINADSLQVYQGADIITNKHPLEERQGIPHHLLGHVGWGEQYTVKNFENEAQPLIEKLCSANKLPILVGGTHYYIQSLISKALIGDLGDASSLTPSQQQILDDPQEVEKQLKLVDPVIAAKFHPNDTRRLRRALEVHFTTGKLPSEIYAAQEALLRYNALVIWIHCEKDILATRLNDRVDVMLEQGLVDEINEMYDYHVTQETNINSSIWQAIGFRQFLPYLESRSDESKASSIEAMKIQTNQYARKQTKWINNKFVPFLNQIGARFAVVDSSNIETWDQDVQARAQILVQEWLDGDTKTDLLLESVLVGRKAQAFDQTQWVRHYCPSCSQAKEREVVIVGTEAWDIHINSKQHRALERRQRLLSEREQQKRAKQEPETDHTD